MNIPRGQGPYPVLILLHGYFDREEYYTGADTWQMADFLARSGYITIAPDYRSWGSSDSGQSLFHTGLVADAINLISSLPSLPQADTARVGLLGHSMGGGIATKVLVIDDRVSAAVLYAPNSADDADLIGRWGPGCLPGQSFEAGDTCNPGEVIPADLPQALTAAYLEAAADDQFLPRVAPINYLEAVKAPVQIHIGEEDGETLQQTPPQWSRKLYEALQAAGKEVTFFSYPDQGHYFLPPALGQLMERSLAFFDEELRN
jgi:dipeptidyl aminopeptidase/acylaminoacyl peptidase